MIGGLLLAEPDFGAATVLFGTGFGLLFVAGARLRYVIVMMVLAIPFAYFQRRAGGMGFRIFVGTILGLVFFLIGRLFAYIGVINDWPPLFSAAFPVCAFVAVAGSMLWWLERR